MFTQTSIRTNDTYITFKPTASLKPLLLTSFPLLSFAQKSRKSLMVLTSQMKIGSLHVKPKTILTLSYLNILGWNRKPFFSLEMKGPST